MKEFTSDQFVEWKRIILDVLHEFDKICSENGLRYFACGGTAIGAVRHQGIIPWDDDIDVSMPRPDYDRFISICEHRDMDDYEVVTPYNTRDFSVPFSKFCSKKTTLVEDPHIPCVIGAFIDVFPLDGISGDDEEAQKMMLHYQKLKNKLEAVTSRSSFSEYVALLKSPHEWGRFVMKTGAFFFRETLRKAILAKIERVSRSYPFETAENVVVYCGSYGLREIMPKSFCEGDDIVMPFEDAEIKMPAGYKEYLTRIYGNYMQLPPKEKQVTHHFHAVVDLHKRLSREDALALL